MQIAEYENYINENNQRNVTMEMTKGWCKWYVSEDYLLKAISQLDKNNVTKIFIVPNGYGYLIVYKNENNYIECERLNNKERNNIEGFEYMRVKEFNEKYAKYLEEGHYGLDIYIPEVIEYLDSEFESEIRINPNFQYSQIKLKFGMARVYAESKKCDEWEKRIDWIITEKKKEMS